MSSHVRAVPPLTGRRVVVVNWRDPWHSSAGGSERFAWELACGLRDAGAAVELWTARDRGQSTGETHAGVRVLRRWGTYGFYAGVWVRLARQRLRGGLPDLVLDMDCGIPAFTPLVLPRRTPVVLVVHHVHQQQFRTAMPRPLAALGRFLERRLMPRAYRRAAAAVAVSESTVREMRQQLGWRGPVRVVHNGVDPVRAGSGTGPADPDRVCALGRLAVHKRVDVVVEAFARVAQVRPHAHLDVVGTGPQEAIVRAAVERLGLTERVSVHGFVSEQEKSDVLAAATLHVCASDAEGWGLVVLEAAAHGVPTLVRHVPGTRDSVLAGRTGWVVPDVPLARLTDTLAEAVLAALTELDDPERRAAMAGECVRWAQGFSWERMREQLVEVAVGALHASPPVRPPRSGRLHRPGRAEAR